MHREVNTGEPFPIFYKVSLGVFLKSVVKRLKSEKLQNSEAGKLKNQSSSFLRLLDFSKLDQSAARVYFLLLVLGLYLVAT